MQTQSIARRFFAPVLGIANYISRPRRLEGDTEKAAQVEEAEVDVKSDWLRKRRRRLATAGFLLVVAACTSLPGLAHTPLLYMEDNGDGTIYVEGGFSDGSSGAGMTLRLEDADGETLWEGILDDFGSVEAVPIPEVSPYYVVFEGGPGHAVRKEGISPAVAAEPEDPVSPASADDPTSAVEPGGTAPSSPTASAPASTAVTSSQPTAWSPAATLSPEWTPTTSAESDGSGRDYAPALWTIVGLLGFIALILLLLGGGVMFLAGWKIGAHRTSRTE
jgi:hypothetical protein